MNTLEETSTSAKSFVSHMTRFDNETKNELMNISQYALLSVIPIALLNKGSKSLFPECDEEKPSFELLVESVGQILYLFVGMYMIHRLVCFVAPYSGEKYGELNITSHIITFLVIVLSLQSKLGSKINVLLNRVLKTIDEYTGLELSGDSEEEAPTAAPAKKAESEEEVSQQPAQMMQQENMMPMAPGSYEQTHQQMTHDPFQAPQMPNAAPPAMAHAPEQAPPAMGGGMELAGSGLVGGEAGSLSYASF
jgi:hypothetical protein